MESEVGVIRVILALSICGFFAACGVDGDPEQPTKNATIVLSGNGGVYGGIGLHQGPVSPKTEF